MAAMMTLTAWMELLPNVIAGFELGDDVVSGLIGALLTIGLALIGFVAVLLGLVAVFLAYATGAIGKRKPKAPKLPSRMIKSATEDSWIETPEGRQQSEDFSGIGEHEGQGIR